ncbi:MAG: Gfo/Idh/MocA family oxidoreductase [Planctomycetes bacterium]|nr:Gfo/Idh/MocA family oxidoreductase [Planctomycetota bacterium]
MVLSLVGVGCGHRTLTYCDLAARQPHRYRVVAGADPVASRLDMVRKASRNPQFRGFASDRELFAAGKLADVAVIGTQDDYHVEPCLRAMELGYDVLLEKPIAQDPREVVRLLAAAERLGRRVLVCHVLRYAPFYEQVKAILATGALGELASIDAREGVVAFHQAHSFVRGHWAVRGRSNPMIVAKCCHDMDIISWLVDRPCLRIGSFGSLGHFNAANAPAGAPPRCTDGCPVASSCPYNAMLYASKHRGYLKHVYDHALDASEDDIRAWLTTSPWGRCAYRCDNDVVDRQVLALEFASGLTGTFTMTAFDHGRNLTICGTRAVLRGGDAVKELCGHDIVVEGLHGGRTYYDVDPMAGGYAGHGGGDPGLVHALADELAKPDPRSMRTGLHASVDSHLMAFAAEESRLAGGVPVDLAEFRKRLA